MLRLLVADDEQDARDKMIRCIDKFQNGLSIVGTASDGYETYEKILELSPDIVLIDIGMPGINGLEVIRKACEAALPVVFIIISSYSEFDYAREALRLNVKEYLLKPFLPADVCQAVYQAAEHIQAVNKLPGLSAVLPSPEKQQILPPNRMKAPLLYPFEQEAALIRELKLSSDSSSSAEALDAFISAVHSGNKTTTAKMNCYVILYVELHHLVMSLGGDFDSLNISLTKHPESPLSSAEQALRQLCGTIQDRLSNRKSSNTIVSSAVQYINECYASDLSLNEVANYVGVSPSYLSNQFNCVLHIHFIDYIHRVRINHAKELMQSQPFLKGYEIGELVGYHSIKYFSQMFKKVTGITLRQFRGITEIDGNSELEETFNP